MSRLEFLWSSLRNSFWFVPALIFSAGIALALGLIEIDSGTARFWLDRWPRVFGSGASGARTMLSTIAGSMMTVVGVTFSMTLVTLALASNQYTSRILRNFMGDRITQVVLGIFGAIFIYCLIVLRTVRGGDDDYVPSLAVLFGVVLAIGGTAMLIFFIHHMANAIQASSVIESVTKETLSSIDRQYPTPESGKECLYKSDAPPATPAREGSGKRVPSAHTGYIQSIDIAALMRIAHSNEAVVHVGRCVGEFVVRGATLAVMDARSPLTEKLAKEIEDTFIVHRFRTVEQDVGFGISQLVDIALRALSPGVNDTTTGLMCVDYLSAILAHLAGRAFPPGEQYCEGSLRVVMTEQGFESRLRDAFDQIHSSARGNVTVLTRILLALRTVGGATQDEARRRSLVDYVVRMREASDERLLAHERAYLEEALSGTHTALLGAADVSR